VQKYKNIFIHQAFIQRKQRGLLHLLSA